MSTPVLTTPVDPPTSIPIDYASQAVQTAPASPIGIPELPFEPRLKRMLFVLIALLLTAGYLFVVLNFWTPSHQGVDQNGYLVGGKMFAQTLSMAQTPTRIGQPEQFDPHQFIANMWVASSKDSQQFYPKYPLGLPLLYAISLWIGGSYGVAIAHLISPITMTLTVLGVFFLARQFTGSFPAILAMLVYATSPIVTWCVNNPNSHATTVFCCVWGMLCILHWWRRGGWFWALAGGFLIGYAATIRYTEGALLLPIAFAAVANLRWRSRRSWIESSLIGVGWLIPVAALLTYNWFEMGTLTGYDATNESTGFAWAFFYDNWETITRQLSENGLFLIMPIAIAGLIAMFWWNWRVGVFFGLWIGPCVTIYTFYYWAPDGLGYLRFVLTVLPPMVVGAFWLIAHIRDLLPKEPSNVPAYLMILVLTFGGLTAGVIGHLGLRLDLQAINAPATDNPEDKRPPIMDVADYLHPKKGYSNFEHHFNRPVFIASLVMLSAWGAAIAASVLLKKSIVPTLAAGVIAFLSVAVQSDNSLMALEKDSFERSWQQVNYAFVKKYVPDGAVLICREEGPLHHLQFERNLICFTGMTFDKNWVNARPSAPIDGPELMDPVRGRQLQEALQRYEPKDLTEQARQMIRDAIANDRRVFVLDNLRRESRGRFGRYDKSNTVPEFVRRFVPRSRDASLTGKQIAWWNIPKIHNDETRRPRGRRDGKPTYRELAYQLWEITVPS